MPTRKQRRREAKAKRHDYEFVYVDAEGRELDEPPEELVNAPKQREERRNGSSGSAKEGAKKGPQRPQSPQRGGRRVPQPPSWQRSFRRAGILGLVVFVLFSFTAKNRSGGYASAAGLAALYTALFIPFTYALDRFAYRRWQARDAQTGPTKKR
jgi:hypothetical protein